MNASSPTAPQKIANQAGQQKRRLLFVEDHEATRTTVARLLQKRGFEVVVAGSVTEARRHVTGTKFAAILSDLALPDGDGCDLLQALQAMQSRPIPSIAISGFGMEQDIDRAREAGFTEHLTKPIDIESLERALQRLFDDP